MFAILISEKNMAKIEEAAVFPSLAMESTKVYVDLKADYYAIRGYVSKRGDIKPFTVLPAFLFEKNFEYDPIKIKTDWDQIVRK